MMKRIRSLFILTAIVALIWSGYAQRAHCHNGRERLNCFGRGWAGGFQILIDKHRRHGPEWLIYWDVVETASWKLRIITASAGIGSCGSV